MNTLLNFIYILKFNNILNADGKIQNVVLLMVYVFFMYK